jgi:hypothetical protein
VARFHILARDHERLHVGGEFLMSIKYAMRSEGRARSVAKDLVKIATEQGVGMKLSQAQKATAQLFGRRNWADLTATLSGTGQGPEDHELTPTDLEARLAAQKSVLLGAGFAAAAVDDVLARLRPTGRSGGAVEARPTTARIADHERYHPYRLDRAIDAVAQVTGTELWEMEFDARHAAVASHLRDWYAGRPSLFVDELTRGEPALLENVLDLAQDFYEENLVIDASGMASELRSMPLSGDLVSGIDFGQDYLCEMVESERHTITHYVHFGDDVFGSPWSDATVQGVYVTFHFDFMADDQSGFIEFAMVAADRSPPVAPGAPMLRNELRVYYHNFLFEDGYGLPEAMKELEEASDDPLRDYWMPYLAEPTAAALNAVALYYRPGQLRRYAIPADAPHELVAQFDRAVTFEQARTAIQNSMGRPPVCILGDAPVQADRSYRIAGVGYEERNCLSDFEAMVEDGWTMRTPEGYLLVARKALEIAEDLRQSQEADVLDEARVNLVGAALASGDVQLATDEARRMLEAYVDLSDVRMAWRPILAIALVIGGERDLADELTSFPVHQEDWHDSTPVARRFLAATEGMATAEERLAALRSDLYIELLLGGEDGVELFRPEPGRGPTS